MKYIIIISILFFVACTSDQVFVPKPRMYPKLTFPVKNNTNFNINNCPFEFVIPDYFEFEQDTFDQKDINQACWFDLYCKELNAYLHMSYLDIENSKHFDQLLSDAFALVDEHNIKASYREELRYDRAEDKVHGVIFEIQGPVATPIQFFLTDSTNHFFRGSLYFKSQVNRDSIAPAYNFLKDDVMNAIDQFKWKY